eukprot:TRINITY_DN79325_c0_g1_i1.p1 TRINITY_DN79325_c0_g1~~TRINITY_DN79325_c0_g1_i1.p1  ORF type:complete len:760 (-),score=140.38 TRINITY_DN79325_c0_g1_i1:6-2264(-)
MATGREMTVRTGGQSEARGSRARSISPTLALYENRKEALERMATMTSMGLHVFHPDWQAYQPGTMPRGRQYSTTFKTTTLKVLGSDEQISIPVQTCTRVHDVKEALASALAIDPESISFLEKRGCSTRKQLMNEEIASVVTVKGITSFKPPKHQWPHPVGVIGAGYNGLKTAMMYAKSGDNNFIVFDRNDKVGGYCWITAANKGSKLQTEFGSFHIWWGEDCVTDGCQYPAGWEIWPKKQKVLDHFHYAAEQYGVLPHFQFKSNVAKLDIIGDKDSHDRYYQLTVMPVDGGESREVNVSVLYNYPGCMTRNRIIDYPGEDVFGGHIAYGMNDDCPYHELAGQNVAILGNGAFAVENARTCVEHATNKVYLLTRRKNLASPRVPCWFVHQGPVPTPGKLVLDMFKPMYELADFGDPWEYWSVHANAERTKVSVIQNSRFGIGDVTFLMVMYGKLEYIQDTLKRCTYRTLHLTGGRKLEDVTVILKSLGLLGDFAVDRLHKMKQMVGTFCDGDWRRPLLIDAIGMNAANFTTFSTGISSHGFVLTNKYLHDHPKEFYRMVDMGLLKQLPVNKADENLDKPAYVYDVKYTMSAGIITESMNPRLSALSMNDPEYKYRMYHAAHPFDYYLEECIKDWDHYQKMFKEQGCDREYVPYPYTKEMVQGYFEEYNNLVGYPTSVDGPPKDAPALRDCTQGAPIGELPAWAKDEKNLDNMERSLLTDRSWWSNNSAKQDMMNNSIGRGNDPELLALQLKEG